MMSTYTLEKAFAEMLLRKLYVAQYCGFAFKSQSFSSIRFVAFKYGLWNLDVLIRINIFYSQANILTF